MVNISKIRSEENETLGAYLKHQRELRGIELEEISQHSLIRMEFLRAIEQEQFLKLPGLAFAKGYLRAYATYIGLDPEDVVLRFEARYVYLNQHHFKSRNVWLKVLILILMILVLLGLLFGWLRS